MDVSKLSKIEPQLAAWRKHVADVGTACGRINELNTRFNLVLTAINAANNVEEVRARLAETVNIASDAEQHFRELEFAASAAKIAVRNCAATIKRGIK